MEPMAINATSIVKEQPSTTSSDFDKMAPYWVKVGDIVEGQDAIIAGGELYLPKFPNESEKDYDFRLKTARFTNVYRDILEGLAQKPFAQTLALENESVDQRTEDLINDIDGRGNSLHVFAAETFFEGINNAIDWILVDYTKSVGARTVEEERNAGVRPYWVHVPANRVIWVESKVMEGREQLTKVKILEAKGRVRTYEREGGKVTWKVEHEKETGVWVVDDEGDITLGVIPMVPFVTGRRKGKHWQFHPPMKDAADLQIELYQQETSLKHIKTMAAFPMLAGNGVEPDTDADGMPKTTPVGPGVVLFAPPNNEGAHGEWSWIITDSGTLTFLSDDVEKTKRELRELGRQPLTAQSGNLTVITTAVAAAKGNSAVQAWALQLKDALDNALALTMQWMKSTTELKVRVFTDFGVDDIDDKGPEHLLKARENGDLSQKTLWDEFKRRGILGPEFDPQTEIDERLFEEIAGGDIEMDLDGSDNSPDGQGET